jgi:hypothetical protein
MKFIKTILILCFVVISTNAQNKKGKHLFILSGQSNMELLRPVESFTPILQKKYGTRKVIVAKYALGTQPIRKWYKNWQPFEGSEPKAEAYLYDSLMVEVKKVYGKGKFKSVTFIWMQGERDAKMGYGNVYEQSLLGLYNQLSEDLERKDINFIIGRLSDFAINKNAWPDWNLIREIQVKVAESNPRFDWIDTDDLNSGINRKGEYIENDIHMSSDGYKIMGERFADKAIKLIKLNSN